MLLAVNFLAFILALVVSLSSAAEENLRVPQKRDLTFCWWPYVWENYQCKYCTNNYVCPANSYRIEHRVCYDDFDDCDCNSGYYKSLHEKKCLPIKQPTPAPVAAPVCKNDFICPENSCRIPNQACYDSFEDCKCNDGFYKSPYEPKCIRVTSAPVKPPTNAPVKPPTSAPVKPPTKAPRRPPVTAPVQPPVTGPVKSPIRAPRRPPVAAPVKPPTYAPVKPPTKAPRKPPTAAPVKPPTKAPRKPPTNAPVKPPTNAPVKPPTNAPVKPPTQAPVKCPYPQQWIDGCCKDVCKNDYVCPENSYRIDHRLCYDTFDDCECKYGYYKSSHEDKCIKYWWCTW